MNGNFNFTNMYRIYIFKYYLRCVVFRVILEETLFVFIIALHIHQHPTIMGLVILAVIYIWSNACNFIYVLELNEIRINIWLDIS